MLPIWELGTTTQQGSRETDGKEGFKVHSDGDRSRYMAGCGKIGRDKQGGKNMSMCAQ